MYLFLYYRVFVLGEQKKTKMNSINFLVDSIIFFDRIITITSTTVFSTYFLHESVFLWFRMNLCICKKLLIKAGWRI